jgi:hypothetical protein
MDYEIKWWNSELVNKETLPKNILILNARLKTELLIEFCLIHGINFKMFELDGYRVNISPKLAKYTTYLPREQLYDPQYYIQNLDFVPDMIINWRDEEVPNVLEYELSQYWKPKTQFDKRALKFFSSKREQDRVCKLMGVPTLDEGKPGDKIIVKLDSGEGGGGDGYKSAIKGEYQPKKNDFIQRYINYEYSIIQMVLCDNDGEYHIYNHTIGVPGNGVQMGQNIPFMYQFPHNKFPKEEMDIIKNFYKKLKEHITVKNRIVATEWSKEKNGKLHFQEFNSRPFGQLEIGSYCWDIGKFNTVVDFFTQKVQPEIEYYQQITSVYLDNIRTNKPFGWGHYKDLALVKLPYSEKIKTWNTKDSI